MAGETEGSEPEWKAIDKPEEGLRHDHSVDQVYQDFVGQH